VKVGVDPGQKHQVSATSVNPTDAYARAHPPPPAIAPTNAQRRVIMKEGKTVIRGASWADRSGTKQNENRVSHLLKQLASFPSPWPLHAGQMMTHHELLNSMKGTNHFLAKGILYIRRFNTVQSRCRPILRALYHQMHFRKETFFLSQLKAKTLRQTGSYLGGYTEVRSIAIIILLCIGG
jgi:hypothetical protein